MRIPVLLYAIFLAAFAMTGCRQEHFISDPALRQEVSADFMKKEQAMPEGNFFAFAGDKAITPVEMEAMQFLYAYMPMGDVTDYNSDFYLKNIRASFSAREEMPWGNVIPEEIFRHFVLPVRVNNENLDESRWVFYDELKDRVKGLSLYDAVLEVNHWCHEKVVYRPSDARTSSALASVRTAYGRCGEESTFAVAALRAVGIPARQVYTPRWAHTDDNHAWVEAWVDGKWMFMGACEPEPVLNLGWFNGPAYRGMLMHTRAFGRYHGPEEVMQTTDCFTEINVISNYAPAAKATIAVTDAAVQPAAGANVEFKIYNYAEFCTVATKQADAQGKTFLSAGKGDMVVWASKDNRFGFAKVSFGKDTAVTIRLTHQPAEAIPAFDWDIVPPVEGMIPADVTDGQRRENLRRLAVEDSIRDAYVATFYTRAKAESLAVELKVDPEQAVRFLVGSRGNYAGIEHFLRHAPAEKRKKAMALLSVISAKDWRDTPASVLDDHLLNTSDTDTSEVFKQYVLNPRVGNELLTPYRKFFQQAIDPALADTCRNDPAQWVDWVRRNIRVQNGLNPQNIQMSPAGVWQARTAADEGSRAIFFVAVARSLGIPARIEPVASKTQYRQDGQWVDVDFDAASQTVANQGTVKLTYAPNAVIKEPQYETHYTIARINPDGIAQTLNLYGAASMTMPLDEGNYMLVSGTRMANGKVLNHTSFFAVKGGQTTDVPLTLRQNSEDIPVRGSIDAEALFKRTDDGKEASILSVTGRGYFIIGILGPRQEPTNHAMRDIATCKKEFEAWGRSMILLFRNDEDRKRFDVKEFGELPATITYGIDTDQRIQQMINSALDVTNGNSLPVFIIADTFGRVVFFSQGYSIGLGEQMLQVIRKVNG